MANVEFNDAGALDAAYALVQIADTLLDRHWDGVGNNDANNNNKEIGGKKNRGEKEIKNENVNGNENPGENGRIADGGEHKHEIKIEMEVVTWNPPRFKCHFCPHFSQKKAHIVTHIRTHTKEKPYECQLCDKKFARTDVLNRHVNTYHRRLKPHKCSMCVKSFGRKDHLDKHMATHRKMIVIEPMNE